MAAKFLLTEMDGTPKQISFATHASYAPATNNVLEKATPVEVEMSLLNLAAAAAIQSAKANLGTKFAERYAVVAAIEMQIASATDGDVVEFYWSASPSGTAAVGNMGAASGADGAYAGYSADLATAVKQLIFIGNLVLTDDGIDQVFIGYVGDLYPPHRYGSLIVRNLGAQTICDTDIIESVVVLNPIVPESQ